LKLVSRALDNHPEIIIADEPTSELDSKTAKEIIALRFDINQKEKTTVLVATHDEKVVSVAVTIYTITDGMSKLHV